MKGFYRANQTGFVYQFVDSGSWSSWVEWSSRLKNKYNSRYTNWYVVQCWVKFSRSVLGGCYKRWRGIRLWHIATCYGITWTGERDTSRFSRPKKKFSLLNPIRRPLSNDRISEVGGFWCRLMIIMPSGGWIVHLQSQWKSARCVVNPEQPKQWFHLEQAEIKIKAGLF